MQGAPQGEEGQAAADSSSGAVGGDCGVGGTAGWIICLAEVEKQSSAGGTCGQ